VTRVPERLEWAVSRLALQPDHHVLELGCGHGVAAGLVCDRLRSGHVTAVDRSAAMIDRARRRNAHHVEAGTLDLAVAAIAQMCPAIDPRHRVRRRRQRLRADLRQ
jgi:ubiquinone/menaquinone biosynthesis C-methylase UbiE